MIIHTRLRTCLLLVGVLLLGGCGDSAPSLLAVKAVAAGIPSLAPFFDEGEQLGRDEPDLRSPQPHSGLQQGNTPGLYGGTQKPKICDVGKLEDFLTAPENKKKAQEWARIVGIDVDGIERRLDELTPVLLRHDTLVKNHDYKKGRAVPFDALLEAGIAVLVDDQGVPAVKCSCGNPLRAFDENPARVKVEFTGAHKKWRGYDKSRVIVVKPAPEPLKALKLIDVEDPDQGISRDIGTAGESDSLFDTRVRQAVPKVRGMPFDEASAAMADQGLAVTVAGDRLPPGDAPVTGSSPGAGAELEFGAAVALRVEWPGEVSEPYEPSEPSEPSDPGDGTGGSGAGSGPGSPSETDGSPTGSSSSGGLGGSSPSEPSEPSKPSKPSEPSEPSEPSVSDSAPAGRDTPPSDGGSSPTDDGSSPTEAAPPPSTGGTSLAPTPSKSSERPSPDPEPSPPGDSGPPTDTPATSAPPSEPAEEPPRFMWI